MSNAKGRSYHAAPAHVALVQTNCGSHPVKYSIDSESKGVKMERWFIDDERVRQLLRENGFVCRLPEEEIYIGHASDTARWYETNCPIVPNKPYILPDGNSLASRGTRLVLVEEEINE
jgi:hypothetical protein